MRFSWRSSSLLHLCYSFLCQTLCFNFLKDSDVLLIKHELFKSEEFLDKLSYSLTRNVSSYRRVLSNGRLIEVAEILNHRGLGSKMSSSDRSKLASCSDVVLGDFHELYDTNVIINDSNKVSAVHVTLGNLEHLVQSIFNTLNLEVCNLVLENTGSGLFKALYLISCLFARSSDAHSLLGSASHFFHFELKHGDFAVSSHNALQAFTKLLDATTLTNYNLSSGFPIKLLYIACNRQRRMYSQVHCISLEVLQMVNAVLHTNQIVQRPHAIQVVRTHAPLYVTLGGLAHPRGHRNHSQHPASIRYGY